MYWPRIQEALIHLLDQQSTALAQLGHRSREGVLLPDSWHVEERRGGEKLEQTCTANARAVSNVSFYASVESAMKPYTGLANAINAPLVLIRRERHGKEDEIYPELGHLLHNEYAFGNSLAGRNIY